MQTTEYERKIITETKQFAQVNNIPFSKMTELIILNTIRSVRNDERVKIKVELDKLMEHPHVSRNEIKEVLKKLKIKNPTNE